jgi:hypothetical protein
VRAPAPDAVADRGGRQQQNREGERVGVDDPRQAVPGEAERVLDRRQRDVHDRGVEHDHELRRREHDEREPAARVGDGGGSWSANGVDPLCA